MASTSSRKIRPSENVLYQEVDGEAVLLNLNNESYFGLDNVGTRIWQLIQEYGDLERISHAMMEEYEVDESRLRTDLNGFLAKLANAELITLEPAETDAEQ
jgi:hypothetical protein